MSGPEFAANSERTGSFHLVNSHRLIMLFPASTERQKVLECAHKSVEKCHYTYVAQFKPSQEEVCDENFEKSCQITFKQQAYNETVRKCCRLTSKVCNGEGPEECRTVYESSCTTKYVGKQPGKFVGDTGGCC